METVLVTGANSGIGRAAAVRLASAGYRVFAGMRSLDKASKLLELCQKAGCEAEPIQLDVTDPDSVKTAVAHIEATTGGVDVLINNAGIGYNGTVEDIDIDAAKLCFETNYWGALRCTQAVLPKMRERRSGHIVNISSIAGRVALLAQAIYSSSKWALEAMSECLGQEVAPFGIRVILIEPGVTRTAILPKNFGTPEGTAYPDAYRRMEQFYFKGAEANVRPELVADVIHDALNDPQKKLRYPCAWSAAELLPGRAQLSDEAWLDLPNTTTDNAYYDRFKEIFGLDLRTQVELPR